MGSLLLSVVTAGWTPDQEGGGFPVLECTPVTARVIYRKEATWRSKKTAFHGTTTSEDERFDEVNLMLRFEKEPIDVKVIKDRIFCTYRLSGHSVYSSSFHASGSLSFESLTSKQEATSKGEGTLDEVDFGPQQYRKLTLEVNRPTNSVQRAYLPHPKVMLQWKSTYDCTRWEREGSTWKTIDCSSERETRAKAEIRTPGDDECVKAQMGVGGSTAVGGCGDSRRDHDDEPGDTSTVTERWEYRWMIYR